MELKFFIYFLCVHTVSYVDFRFGGWFKRFLFNCEFFCCAPWCINLVWALGTVQLAEIFIFCVLEWNWYFWGGISFMRVRDFLTVLWGCAATDTKGILWNEKLSFWCGPGILRFKSFITNFPIWEWKGLILN